MIHLRNFIAGIVLILISSSFAFGQRYSNTADSIAIDQTTALLFKIDSIRKADSVRRSVLLEKIKNLQGSESQQKSLLRKIKELEAEDSIHSANQFAQLVKLKKDSTGYPIAPFSDTLFFIHTKQGSFSPKDRAELLTTRIRKLYDDPAFEPDSLKTFTNEITAEIVFRDRIVMNVNEMEALWYNKKPVELADQYRVAIRDSIRTEREANSIQNILMRIAAVLLILAGVCLVIFFFIRIFKRITNRIVRLKDVRFKGIRIKNYQLLDSGRELRLIVFLLKFLRLILIVLALYVALPLTFSVFPWSQGIAETLISWILSPLKLVITGLIEYLPDLFAIIVIAIVTRYVVKFMEFIAGEIESGALLIPDFYPDWARPTLNIIKVLVYAFSFIIIFPYLPGSDSPVFQGVSVFLGILFSLGSSSAIANAVAGLVITYMRPFKVGDRIKIGEITGDVIQKTLLVTRIRTIKNEDITVPNSSILSGHTINYSTSAKELGLILNTTVTIGYDAPWKQVHELLISAALETKDIMKDETHRPFILQTSLDDFYVSYQLNAYTEKSNLMATTYSELHQHIQDKFNEAGVEIMSPHYRAARDGNQTTVPSDYLPKDYVAPSFNVTLNKGKENGK